MTVNHTEGSDCMTLVLNRIVVSTCIKVELQKYFFGIRPGLTVVSQRRGFSSYELCQLKFFKGNNFDKTPLQSLNKLTISMQK